MSEPIEGMESENQQYSISRVIKAPVGQVWNFWTDPEHLQHWFCPKSFKILNIEIDLRVGGAWSVRMQGPDESTHCTSGVFQQLNELSLLEFTQSWEDSEHQSLVTVELTAQGDETNLVFTQSELESKESRDSQAEGWSEALDNLASYINS
jgi:uncharacterized protein YndB with AHSA1/START domain